MPLPTPRIARWWPAAVLAAGVCGGAQAQTTVYRCTDAGGKSTYQPQACDEDAARQREVKLPAVPPTPAQPASRAAAPRYEAPRFAAITFYYDPKDEPVGFTTAQMEAMIRAAAAAWSSGCQVDLRYGGRAPRRPGSPDHVSIHWVAEFMYVAHPADGRSGIAGVGSLSYGIGLRPRFAEAHLFSTLVHEIGHVLGLPHNHEDTQSVMSYLRDESTRRKAQPAASDFLDCNLSMKKMFGIDFKPPADAPAANRRRMSDREALEKIHGPRSPESKR